MSFSFIYNFTWNMDTKQEIASQYVIANKQECVDLLRLKMLYITCTNKQERSNVSLRCIIHQAESVHYFYFQFYSSQGHKAISPENQQQMEVYAHTQFHSRKPHVFHGLSWTSTYSVLGNNKMIHQSNSHCKIHQSKRQNLKVKNGRFQWVQIMNFLCHFE